jgi:hypothetical protein
MTSPPIRVETVRVRNAGRRPLVIAVVLLGLVALSIVKPWAGPDPVRPAESPAPIPAAFVLPLAPSSARDSAEAALTAGVLRATEPSPLAPGQIACGSADWRIVTLGGFTDWTVRTWIAIAPVEASGPGDASIPVLSLGHSDVAGLGACASAGGVAAPGRASRIVAAWQKSAANTAIATFRQVPLADLDALSSGGPAGARPGARRPVAELVRPVSAAPDGRWPAGLYVLRLASPDASPDRWIGVEFAAPGA